jgi:peroxiredoxin
MKRRITGLLVLCPFALFAQTNFMIKGKVSGPIGTPAKIYMNYNNGESYLPTDSAEIKNGQFEISGTMKDDDYNTASISIGKSSSDNTVINQRLTLFIKKGDNIVLDVAGGDARKALITGSKQSEAYQLVQDSLSHTKNADDYLVIFKRLIGQYPDSKMALTAFSGRFGSNLSKRYPDKFPEIMKLYDMFSPRIRSTKEGAICGKSLEAVSHLIIGGTLLDFTSKTTESKVVKLSDFRGKYVLVDFWASWCIPCRAEFPFLKKAYARFKSKNFEIVGYSIDNDRSLWISALENDDVPWVNVSNLIGTADPIALSYQVYAVPSNFLIGPDGKVIAINLRGELVEPTLAKFIK